MKLSLCLVVALCLGGVVYAQGGSGKKINRRAPAPRRAAPRRPNATPRPAPPEDAPPGTPKESKSLPTTNQPLQGFAFGRRLNANTVAANNNSRAGRKIKKNKRHRRRHRRAGR